MKTTQKNDAIIPITFDYVFTSIFNDPNNIDIIENFLSIYLNENIKKIKGNVEIMHRNLKLANKNDGKKEVDLLLKLDDETINIELNNSLSKGRKERNIVYAAKVHGRQVPKGVINYTNIQRTIQINLNNFSSNENKLRETYFLRNEKGKILSDKFQIDFIDLEKASEKLYNKDEKLLARWCRIITANSREELEKELGEDLMDKETKEKLIDEVDKYTDDEDVVALYWAHTREEEERLSYEKDKEEERQKFEKEKSQLNQEKSQLNQEKSQLNQEKTQLNQEKTQLNQEKKQFENEKIKLIKNMYENNINIETISKLTKYPINKINNIIKNIN